MTSCGVICWLQPIRRRVTSEDEMLHRCLCPVLTSSMGWIAGAGRGTAPGTAQEKGALAGRQQGWHFEGSFGPARRRLQPSDGQCRFLRLAALEKRTGQGWMRLNKAAFRMGTHNSKLASSFHFRSLLLDIVQRLTATVFRVNFLRFNRRQSARVSPDRSNIPMVLRRLTP